MPDTPPDLTGSKSSKSSSFHSSYQSDGDGGMLTDSAHFEDIGLDDETRAEARIGEFDVHKSPSAYSFSAAQRQRALVTGKRDLTARAKPAYPSLRGQVRGATVEGLGIVPLHPSRLQRGVTSPISPTFSTLPQNKRNRSSSPNLPVSPNHLSASQAVRRETWQSNRDRKTTIELEKECEEDDGDDVPDDCLLENVPMSPRPPSERSRPPSASTSPERRPHKDRVRSVGNGTSPIPAEQGELRSPRMGLNRGASMGQFPINHGGFKPRAKSWTDALSDLSEEAKALTEALEAHADEAGTEDAEGRNSPAVQLNEKSRAKSAIAELPPLRRTNIMIDPLPISKEKEAVLSRTRPSWLPPKDPSEEKRHLKEYQRMMALSLTAERKREASEAAKSACRDDTASSLLRIWEEHVLPNWESAIRQKRTRELWWRGIAPRSRGAVWAKAIGNELGLSEASYTAALRRAQALEKTIKQGSQLSAEEERRKGWLDQITKDACATYPELRIFQPEGPLHQSLLDVLKAYAMYRSDVGYISGTNTTAALLLLNLPTPSTTFLTLSNLLNRSLPLSFLTHDPSGITKTYTLTLIYLSTKSPRLHAHLVSPHLAADPDAYLRPLYQSLFAGNLELDAVSRLWDVMVFEGDAVLVRAAVALLMGLEARLFGAENEDDVVGVVEEGTRMGEVGWMALVREAGRGGRGWKEREMVGSAGGGATT